MKHFVYILCNSKDINTSLAEGKEGTNDRNHKGAILSSHDSDKMDQFLGIHKY
jgi:hypothetical protein